MSRLLELAKNRSLGYVVLLGVILSVALPATAQVTGGPFQYFSVTPCRIADTRNASFTAMGPYNGPPKEPAGAFRLIKVKGNCGVPVDAAAVSLNAAVLNPTSNGFFSLWPAGGAFPVVSTINFQAFEPGLANGAIVPLAAGAAPDLNIVYGDAGTTPGAQMDFILDVTGYFK
jgi:hypothetical protein